MTNVTVIDTIMGAGKTSYIIEYMNRAYVDGLFNSPNRRFIVSVRSDCPMRQFSMAADHRHD